MTNKHASEATSKVPSFAVTVDVVVVTLVGEQLHVLLVERARAPYRDCWALPGGFKDPDETLEAAALRELREETGAEPESGIAQIGAYGDPGRDPRGNVVTVAFVAVMKRSTSIRAGDDAKHASLHPLADVITGRLPAAFDHRRIVADAVEFLRRNVNAGERMPPLVQSPFSRAELRAALERLPRPT